MRNVKDFFILKGLLKKFMLVHFLFVEKIGVFQEKEGTRHIGDSCECQEGEPI